MKSFSIGCLRVASLLSAPIGIILFFISVNVGQVGTSKGFIVTPMEAIILAFLGLLGNVVCGIAEKPPH